MEEIEKLRLKVEKDPNSRFFLPLAEEYRKSAMLDEAITVILRGLEYQPGYTSARVALGRIYLEKNMIQEARNEFENVVKSIPDNLFSHKKLAEIYKASGEIDMAIREYSKVIELNPLDDDARVSLEEMEGRPEPEEVLSHTAPVESEAPAAEDKGLHGIEEVLEEELKEAIATEAGTEDAYEEFKASFSPVPEETVDWTKDSSLPHAEESAAEDIFASPAEHEEDKDVSEGQAEEAGVIELPEDAGLEDAFAMESFDEAETASPVRGAAAGQPFPGGTDEVSAADSFIAGGDYYKAMEIFRKILGREPDNKHVLQRVTELKALLTLLGKGDEVIIARLDSFLGATKRHFDRKH